jgi:hypothetical protein
VQGAVDDDHTGAALRRRRLPRVLHDSPASVGHLPPALRRADGTVQLVAAEPSLLVGAALGTDRQTVEAPVERGSVLAGDLEDDVALLVLRVL